MATIKEIVNLEINEHQDKLKNIFNILIKDVHDTLISFENTNSSYGRICLGDFETFKNLNYNQSITIKHQTYKDSLLRNKCNFDNIDINKVIHPHNENELNSYVIIKLNANYLSIYHNDYECINQSFDNISNAYNLNDTSINSDKLKIYKLKHNDNFYVFLFLDSLRYNDEYIFDNNFVTTVENNAFNETPSGTQHNSQLSQTRMQTEHYATQLMNSINSQENHIITIDVCIHEIEKILIDVNNKKEESDRNLVIDIENKIIENFDKFYKNIRFKFNESVEMSIIFLVTYFILKVMCFTLKLIYLCFQ